GLVPVSKLGGEYLIHDDRSHALVGERSGARWPLGMTVEVRLTEATPITGGLVFQMLSEPMPRDPKAPQPRLGMRARGDRKPGGAFKGPPRQGPPAPGQPGRPKNIRNGRRRGGPRR